jgi:Catalase (peroxidase I)
MAKKEKNRGLVAVEPGFSLIDENMLKSRIYTIRGVKVMLDADLAGIYGYETRFFNRQVKNNIERFAEDFRFQLTEEEMQILMCKIAPQVGVVLGTLLSPSRSKASTCS